MPWSVETKLPSEPSCPAEAPTCHDASTAATPARTCPACAAAGASSATTAVAAPASFPPPIATPNGHTHRAAGAAYPYGVTESRPQPKDDVRRFAAPGGPE